MTWVFCNWNSTWLLLFSESRPLGWPGLDWCHYVKGGNVKTCHDLYPESGQRVRLIACNPDIIFPYFLEREFVRNSSHGTLMWWVSCETVTGSPKKTQRGQPIPLLYNRGISQGTTAILTFLDYPELPFSFCIAITPRLSKWHLFVVVVVLCLLLLLLLLPQKILSFLLKACKGEGGNHCDPYGKFQSCDMLLKRPCCSWKMSNSHLVVLNQRTGILQSISGAGQVHKGVALISRCTGLQKSMLALWIRPESMQVDSVCQVRQGRYDSIQRIVCLLYSAPFPKAASCTHRTYSKEQGCWPAPFHKLLHKRQPGVCVSSTICPLPKT